MSKSAHHLYEFGPFRLYTGERLLLRHGQSIQLTPKAFDTLTLLVENGGHVVEKGALMESIWPDTFVDENTLTRNISTLRKALDQDGNGHQYIETVPKLGYRFVTDVREIRDQSAYVVLGKSVRSHIVIEEETDGAGQETKHDQAVEHSSLSQRQFVKSGFALKSKRAVLTVSILLIGIIVAVVFWRSNHKAAIAAPEARNEAREAYLLGRSFWNKRTTEGLFKSISYFEEAIRKDRDFALGYAGLADAYAFDLAYWPKAEELANKALELDNTLAEPHATLGFIRMFWQWNWDDAEREFKRAVELNPGYATAHQWYAIYIAAHHLRPSWGEVEMQKALELEPSSLPINADIGQIHYFAHEYDQAIAACKKAVDLDPDFINAHVYLYEAYTQTGMYAEAAEEFFKFRKLVGDKQYTDPANEEQLRKGYAADGIRGIWKASVDVLREGYTVDAYSTAEYYALLGEKDQALDWLAKAFETHAFALALVKVNPAFESLHSDPRFRDLLVRSGFASRDSFK
jgi:DNA-binding winged helix-turn-helix (wHTH) protein/Tfp pilus assembly protein PilF